MPEGSSILYCCWTTAETRKETVTEVRELGQPAAGHQRLNLCSVIRRGWEMAVISRMRQTSCPTAMPFS